MLEKHLLKNYLTIYFYHILIEWFKHFVNKIIFRKKYCINKIKNIFSENKRIHQNFGRPSAKGTKRKFRRTFTRNSVHRNLQPIELRRHLQGFGPISTQRIFLKFPGKKINITENSLWWFGVQIKLKLIQNEFKEIFGMISEAILRDSK